MIDEIGKVRRARLDADESLFAQQNRLRAKEYQLVRARRLGAAGAEQVPALEREIAALKESVARERSNLQALTGQLGELVGEFVLPQSPQELASLLDDALPCLLFPVRIETRFMNGPDGRELWVRVYPDDIAVHTHEKTLTRDEAVSGLEYWTARVSAERLEDPDERERLIRGAWRALAAGYGGTRASWIAADINRRAIEKSETEGVSIMLLRALVAGILNDPRATSSEKRAALLELLEPPHPLIDAIRDEIAGLLQQDPDIRDDTRQAIVRIVDDGILVYLGFDLEALKPESWSRAPRTDVLPERFVLIGVTNGIRQEWPFPTTVPSPLILGPNPQELESELAQQGGDLVVGPGFAWIWDFEEAIKVGMAMRVPLPEPFASAGFDRLMVLGMHVSASPADHKAMLEELIDSHHYSPEGMGFMPQGTPTNHTGDVRSGYSVDDAEGDASFDVEATPPVVQPATDDLEKRDGQRLAEAWDVELEKLAVLRHAGRRDVSDAKVMNRAMWPATLGYYLEELLETDAGSNDRLRQFFTSNVVARGTLPAIRVGKQPYGVLVTSAFGRWQVNDAVDGDGAPFLRRVHEVLSRVETQWQSLVGQVSHTGAPGDSFAHLLNMLGLQASSVDFQRRIGTAKTMLWNLAHFTIGRNFTPTDPEAQYFQQVNSRGAQVLNDLGFTFPRPPRLFGLLFSEGTSGLNGPFVDDVASAEEEQLSETRRLPPKYAVAAAEGEPEGEPRNYIGWLVGSGVETLRQQDFRDEAGASLPIPAALLYRLLHRGLLLAQFDASMKLYEELALVGPGVRREEDFTNVEAGRTVTRWEFMGATVGRVMPEISGANLAVADWLATPEASGRPAAELLREVRESIARLEQLTTAELERLAAEHIDLCSYRLDGWQAALFSQRLDRLNVLRGSVVDGEPSKRGLHLGAYGWLENVRPAPAPEPVPPDEIPEPLREEGVQVVEQPDNGGYIHGPSINHAVAAAVLRNAYLTHADQQNASHFSVRVTSERVRTAVAFLEGVRNGQELGALLGYQFERALHDRYVIDGTALSQFILAFRKQYPLVADKVTPDEADEPIRQKEAYQVVDGYALLQAVFLDDPPLQYPFGVEGLPLDPANGARQAIIAEVDRLQDTLDAIADLSLAEGVFQVTQGNYERAGAMLKAIAEGHTPPEPEIIHTPRGGAVVNHRLAIHIETGIVAPPWSGTPTPKALAAPGLNKWLGDRIGDPESLQFSVSYDLDDEIVAVTAGELGLQPIDVVYLVGDEAGAIEGGRQVNDLTELEVRIDHAYRLKRKAEKPDFDPFGQTTINFMSRAGFTDDGARTFFELLPLVRNLRNLVTSCRPLGADDYVLPSEENTDPNAGNNVKRWNLQTLEETFEAAAATLQEALDDLQDVILTIPPGALARDPADAPDLSGVDYGALRSALIRLSQYGLPGAFPKNAFLPELPPNPPPAEALALLRAQQALIEQAFLTHALGTSRRAQALALSSFEGMNDEERNRLTVEEKAAVFQRAAALVLGDAFRIIPTFTFRNRPEVEAAVSFAIDAPPEASLLRFTHQRLAAEAEGSSVADWRSLAVDEWLQGVAAVRQQVRLVDVLQTYQEAFDREPLTFQPLQLPFDEKAHWIAMEFPEVTPEHLDDPEVFVPRGDFLSVVRLVPAGHALSDDQAGLLVDEWNEVIPNRIETTGVAVHYSQPNTEPPQCLLLTISPAITGHWEWDDLVATVMDTFDRAKRRAVEPDFLRTTPYAQLLPAILSTFTSFPFGTISTNLSAQPASMVFEEGQ